MTTEPAIWDKTAKLVKAIPDMINFVEAIARCVKCSESENPHDSEHLPQVVDGWIEAARAAIAKATGE